MQEAETTRAPEKTGSHVCFGGDNTFYKHPSSEIGGPMNFTVYVPPQAKAGKKVPALLYLAGLTCDHTTFIIKGGAQRLAAQHGFVLVAPDTSPRDRRHPGDDASWDFGIAAGFYVDATQEPWRNGYRMGTYVSKELPELVDAELPVDTTKWGVFGHSMGGHGALITALRNPDRFKSVSAFAPIVAPSQVPWGHKALGNYLGQDREAWKAWDATELVKAGKTTSHILIDQGTADQFLEEQLRPQIFEEACKAAGQPLKLRMQDGYDHSYYTMQTFMEDHITHHLKVLGG
jgi:S-formylglutathione hydrolase